MVPYALPMVRVVKQWAKVLQVCDAFTGYLNPLGWTLLVLQWLVRRGDLPANWDDIVDLNLISEAPRNKIPTPAEGSSGSYSRTILADFFLFVAKFKRFLPGSNKGGDDDDSGAFISLFDVEGVEEEQGSGDNSPVFLEDPAVRLLSGGSQNVARALRLREWRLTLSRCQEAARQLSREETAMQWARTLTSEVHCPAPAATAKAKTKAALIQKETKTKTKMKSMEVDCWSSGEKESSEEEEEGVSEDEDMRRWQWKAPPDSEDFEDASSPSSSSSISASVDESEALEKRRLQPGNAKGKPKMQKFAPPAPPKKNKETRSDDSRNRLSSNGNGETKVATFARHDGVKAGLATDGMPKAASRSSANQVPKRSPTSVAASPARSTVTPALPTQKETDAPLKDPSPSPSPSPEGALSGAGGAAWKWMR